MTAAPRNRGRDPLEPATLEVLKSMFELIRATALHGPEHELVQDAAEALGADLEAAEPPFSLLVFADAVLRERTPLHFELEEFRRVQQLTGAMRRWSAQELRFENAPDNDVLIAFAQAVNTATHVNRAARKPKLPGIVLGTVWRPFAPQSPAAEAALEVYAGAQLVRACAQVEPMCKPENAWSWPQAEALCARLERLTAAGASAAARALELELPPWPVARQCVALAFYVGAVLARMQVGALSRRAIVHAALALGCHGLPSGMAIDAAARAALPRLLAAVGRKRCDPHQLRACALLGALGDPAGIGARFELNGLLHAAYDVELQRTLAVPGVQQSRVDLHAWLAQALGTHVHPGWGRALLSVLGLVPAGSHVIADGRLGIVLGPGSDGDPFRPRVLLGGAPANPTAPVQLHSPLAMTPWAK